MPSRRFMGTASSRVSASAALFTAILLSPSVSEDAAQAATIERMAQNGGSVTLKLSKEEQQNLKTGDRVVLKTTAQRSPVEGKIIQIRKGRAHVIITQAGEKAGEMPVQTARSQSFKKLGKKGGQVQVAAASGFEAMTVTPPSPHTESASASTPRAGLDTSVSSAAFTSPAQLYQMNSLRSDMQLGFRNERHQMKSDSGSFEYSPSGPFLEALVAAPISKQLTLGLGVGYAKTIGRSEMDTTGSQFDFSTKSTTIQTMFSPTAAFKLTPEFVAGLVYKVLSFDRKSDNSAADHSLMVALPTLGAIYAKADMEVGLTYQPPAYKESRYQAPDGEGSAEVVSFNSPTIIAGHIQGKMDSATTLFAEIAHNQNYVLNRGDDGSWSNNADLTAGINHRFAEQINAEFALLTSTPAYSSADEKNSGNIPAYGFRTAFEKSIGTSNNRLGAGLSYLTASDNVSTESDGDVKLTRSEMVMMVSGRIYL